MPLPTALGRILVLRRFTCPSNWWCEDHEISHGCQGQLAPQICWIWRHYLLSVGCNMQLHIGLTENTNLAYKSKRCVKNRNIIDCLSDVAHHVGSKLFQAAVFSGKTSNDVVRRLSQSERLKNLENVLESPNFTLHPCWCNLEPLGYDDISYAGRHFWKLEKTVQNAASNCSGSNFSGATFCLPHQLVGFLSVTPWLRWKFF